MIKNIILTSANENINLKGVCTLENTENNILVNLKTFNLNKTNNKRVLAINIGEDLFKVEINNNDSYLINNKINLNNKISVVLMEFNNNNEYEILLWGSNNTSRVWKDSILDCINLNENKKSEEENKLHNFINACELEIEKEEESFVNNETYSDNIDYEQHVPEVLKIKNKEFVEENFENNKSEFLSSIEEQINELLNMYEKEEVLEELIPNSTFVKVDLENNGNYYVFGVIYENGEIKYIVYGLPGEFNIKPEDEYSKYYQWLPINEDNPEGYGYYLMYQDAISGSQIEMIYE